MTDEEIKTALNCCMEWTANGGKTDCANCPMDKEKPCHINLHLAAIKYIEELEEKNAALRERLDKAVEFPRIRKSANYARTGKYVVEFIREDDGGVDLDIDLTKEEAEARLKELKEKKQ